MLFKFSSILIIQCVVHVLFIAEHPDLALHTEWLISSWAFLQWYSNCNVARLGFFYKHQGTYLHCSLLRDRDKRQYFQTCQCILGIPIKELGNETSRVISTLSTQRTAHSPFCSRYSGQYFHKLVIGDWNWTHRKWGPHRQKLGRN